MCHEGLKTFVHDKQLLTPKTKTLCATQKSENLGGRQTAAHTRNKNSVLHRSLKTLVDDKQLLTQNTRAVCYSEA
jgi:hypothetical protein